MDNSEPKAVIEANLSEPKKNNTFLTVALSLIIVASLGVATYYGFNYYNDSTKLNKTNDSDIATDNLETTNIVAQNSAFNVYAYEYKPSTELDNIWEKLTQNEFTLKRVDPVLCGTGDCPPVVAEKGIYAVLPDGEEINLSTTILADYVSQVDDNYIASSRQIIGKDIVFASDTSMFRVSIENKMVLEIFAKDGYMADATAILDTEEGSIYGFYNPEDLTKGVLVSISLSSDEEYAIESYPFELSVKQDLFTLNNTYGELTRGYCGIGILPHIEPKLSPNDYGLEDGTKVSYSELNMLTIVDLGTGDTHVERVYESNWPDSCN